MCCCSCSTWCRFRRWMGARVSRYFLPHKVEQVYNQIGGYGIILVFFFAGRLIASIYWPLLGMFDTVLMKM